MSPRRSVLGFTLVEVVVALVVLAAVSSGCFAALRSQILQATYVRDTVFANWLARNEQLSVRLAGQRLLADAEGTMAWGGQNWTWRRTISSTQGFNVYELEMDVRSVASGAGATLKDFVIGPQ